VFEKVAFLFLLALIISCKQKEAKRLSFNKDSLFSVYLNNMNKSQVTDSKDLNFNILQAYKNNDSLLLYKTIHKQVENAKFKEHIEKIYSALNLKKVNEIDAEQVYRFNFSSAFCITPTVLTVYKKNNTIRLQLIVYQADFNYEKIKVLHEINKEISIENWNKFELKLSQADVWGLKSDNEIQVLDGCAMIFSGYEKLENGNKETRECFIKRQVYTTLREPFDFLMMISGNTKGCYWIKLAGQQAT
jgi:hypothetical protein